MPSTIVNKTSADLSADGPDQTRAGRVGPLHKFALRLRCRGEGVSSAITGKRGREFTTPAVGLRSRRCVVKPDPITPHGQSSRGAAEGEGRFPTAMVKVLFQNTSLHLISDCYFHTTNTIKHDTIVLLLPENLEQHAKKQQIKRPRHGLHSFSLKKYSTVIGRCSLQHAKSD